MPKKFKPSAAARPSAVKMGGSGADCASSTRPCIKEAKHSDHAERSGMKVLLDRNSNQRGAKKRKSAELIRLQDKTALVLL
jgi:hypothetical protein